ncbi:hypothetical protein R3P38DRAFT_3574775, partial [Favolaschia claudopus]
YFSSAVVNVHGDRSNGSGNLDSLVDFNFRRIPWGDVFLQRQLYVNGFDYDREHFRCNIRGVRIVRSAKIDGHNFTVATYEGKNTENQWKQDVERYMDIRHQNILQLYGTVRGRNICAAVFHGDFIPLTEFLKIYQHFPILTCYIHGYITHDQRVARDYLYSTWMRTDMTRIFSPVYDMLINSSNGRLSIDLTEHPYDWYGDNPRHISYSNLAGGPLPPMEVLASTNISYVLNTMTLDQFHRIADERLTDSRLYQVISPESAPVVHLGGVYRVGGDGESFQLVALPQLHPDYEIMGLNNPNDLEFQHMPSNSNSGRMRISYAKLKERTYIGFEYAKLKERTYIGVEYVLEDFKLSVAWLNQANHIFRGLNVTKDLHKYVFVESIYVQVDLEEPGEKINTLLQGYLFMRPAPELSRRPGSFKFPDRPWYWSIDSSGAEELSEGEATKLGFPPIQLRTEIWVRSWDEPAYTGLRQYHRSKGFDPETQDVAVELGQPLFELSLAQEPLLVRGPIYESDEEESDDHL